MSQTTILLHCVWSTKNRAPMLINRDRRYDLFNHIRQYAHEHNILVDCVGGWIDHLHCLLFLHPHQDLSSLINLLKGESSHWYNQHGRTRISWQSHYFASSVSPDRIATVRRYIYNQENHHGKISFTQEYNDFIRSSHIPRPEGLGKRQGWCDHQPEG